MATTLILGTAGHIDHGKTSLVKALTGIDTDRLPEEKKRGITIDIGYAHLDLEGVRLGIVDVPGHEKFIKNMLAAVTGIDLALLVVAADDSIMPQTREHLEILKLLGVRHGVIAITKADTVDETTREVVALEIQELVKDSFLENAPIVVTSAHTGTGLAELKATLKNIAGNIQVRTSSSRFRLAIDRAFVVQGHGTIVTGSVASGAVRVDDELDWTKADGSTLRTRVRGLANHGQSVSEISVGQRAAINLPGVTVDEIARGQELSTPGMLVPSKMISVRLHVPVTSVKPIKHRLPIRVHIGTAEVMATVSVLDADAVQPGEWALAQLFLENHITATWGQTFVVRDSSAEHTLGGGQVLQPVASKIKRQNLDSLKYLEDLWATDEAKRLAAAVWFEGLNGLTLGEMERKAGITNTGTLLNLETLSDWNGKWIHKERLKESEGLVLKHLAKLHQMQPLVTGYDRGMVAQQLSYLKDDVFVAQLIDRMVKQKQITSEGRRIARADFKPKLSINQRKLKDKIVEEYKLAKLAPPESQSFANQAMGNANVLKDIFDVACAEDLLVKVAEGIFVHTETAKEIHEKVTAKLKEKNGLTVAEIRDVLGTTRKYAVPICEYLDRVGITKRVGDTRVLALVEKRTGGSAI